MNKSNTGQQQCTEDIFLNTSLWLLREKGQIKEDLDRSTDRSKVQSIRRFDPR